MTKVNYKIAILFALMILICSVFLVGFTDENPTVYAAEKYIDVNSFASSSSSWAFSGTQSSTSTALYLMIQNQTDNYLNYRGGLLKLTISNFSSSNSGDFSFSVFSYGVTRGTTAAYSKLTDFVLSTSTSDSTVIYITVPCFKYSEFSASSYVP